MKEKSKRSGITSVGEAINKLFETYKTKGRFDEAQLVASWERLLGKTIANRTSKLYIKNNVLFVQISSAPLKHELNMSKQKILDLFQQEFGKSIVQEIIII